VSALPRLKRRREFLLVAAQGRKWVAPGLILQVSPQIEAPAGVTGESPTLRIGFTVSRKVGNAVARNRVRRRLRAAAEAVMPTHARQGFDYVVIGRRHSLTRPFPALLQDLEVALRKVRAERGEQSHPAAQTATPDGSNFRQGPG
jgi:ribonuclease P protein component